MAEEENFLCRSWLFQLSGFVGEHFAGEVILTRDFERVGVLLPGRMERQGQNGFPGGDRLAGKRQEGDLVTRIKRIGGREENSDVVLGVCSDDCGFKPFGWAIATADQDVRLAAVPKCF